MSHNFEIYHKVCAKASEIATKEYSTSFSKAIELYSLDLREDIYNIYGFVRFADEIVDTFHSFDKDYLLNKFVDDYEEALKMGLSLNPILHSFVRTQRKYNIEKHLVDSFLHSMRMDLGDMTTLSVKEYKNYIYGSAEVVGLMCLNVFVKGDKEEYNRLKPFAQQFGSALQKINFLRDIHADYEQLNRVYFPNVDFSDFSNEEKKIIEDDIKSEFDAGLQGILRLPKSSKYAVLLAHSYYSKLLEEIKQVDANKLFTTRISVSDKTKAVLFAKVLGKQKLGI